MKLHPAQLVPVVPCLLHVGPCEERASVLFVAVLLSWGEIIAINPLQRTGLSLEILSSFSRIKGSYWRKNS